MVKSSRTKSSQFKEKRASPKSNHRSDQMFLIHKDFKRFHAARAKDFPHLRKVPSIM